MNETLLAQLAARNNTDPQTMLAILNQAASSDDAEQRRVAKELLATLVQQPIEEPKESERALGDRLNAQTTGFEANSLGWLLAHKLFEKHDGLFRKSGKFTQAEGVGRLVHAWLDLLPPGELNDLLTADDRTRSLSTADAGEWLNRHWKDLDGDGVVPWDADGLGDLVAEEIADAGRFRDAASRVARRARVAVGLAQWHPPFLQLLAMIRVAEELDDSSPEEITDMLSNALRRIRGLGPRTGPAYRKFLVGMHALLRFAPATTHSVGWLQSLSAIGAHASAIKQPPFLRLSTVMYEFLLRRLCEAPLIGTESERWGRAQVAANNISGHVSTLAGFDSGVKEGLVGDQLVLARLLNRMQVISVLGTLAEMRQPRDPGVPADWQTFGFDITQLAPPNTDPTSFDTLARAGTCLRAMNNVMSGWAYLDESLFEASLGEDWPMNGFLGERTSLLLATFGALVRCRHTRATAQDLDEAPSSLFNAGLSVTRLRRNLDTKSEFLQMAEMMFYCAGLHFALSTGSSLDGALRDLNGGSCLTNLVGCATNIQRAVREQPTLATAVYRLTLASQELRQGDGLVAAQQVRIDESLRELAQSLKRPKGFEPRSGGHRTAGLLEMIEGLADALAVAMNLSAPGASSQALPGASQWRSSFEEAAFPVLREVCRRVVEYRVTPGMAPTTTFDQVISQVLRLLAEMTRLSATDGTDVLERMVLGPRRPGADNHTELRRQLCAQEQSGEEWRNAFDSLKSNRPQAEPPLTSYTEWLNSGGVLSWLRRVQIDGS